MNAIEPEAIKEFRSLYLREIGEELSEGEAQRVAEDLLALFEVISRSTKPRIDMIGEMTPDNLIL